MAKTTVESIDGVYLDFSKDERIKVLHVDDEPAVLAVTKQCLEEQSKFQLDTALSAEEALEKLKLSEYDAIICDYQMPGKNGLELLRELRQQGNNTPFILFTSKGKEEIAIEALNSGVYRYVAKQGNAEMIYEELKRSLCDAVKGQRAEKLLKAAEKRLSQISDNMQDLLLLLDENLVIKYASASYKSVVGYAPSELIGKRAYDFVHPDDLPKVIETTKKAFKEKSIGRFEGRVRCADGSYVFLEGIGKGLVDENGDVTGAVMTSRDVTKRKHMEETLQQSETRFRQVAENALEWIWDVDAKGLYTYASPVVEKVIGYKPEEIVGKKHFYDLFHPEEREELKKAAFQAFAQKRPIRDFVNRNVHKNGTTVWLSTSGVPIVDEKGKLRGYRGADTDITERKKIEQTLKDSEEKYRKLFNEAIDAIFVADAETGIIIDCNRAATELTGKTKSELIGMQQRLLHPKSERKGKFSETFEKHISDEEGQIIASQVVTKKGEIIDVMIKGSLVEVKGKKLLQGIFRDVTERKKVEEKIRFQARLLNAIGQAVIAADTNGVITYWNHVSEQLYGWTAAEVLGRNLMEIFRDVVQEDVRGFLNNISGNKSWTGEVILKRRDGTAFSVIITTSPITDDSGEVTGILSVSTDITEQKWMQEVFNEAIGKVVELNEKLHVVGSLTRHDIRNKLAALNGRIFLLKKRLNGNTEALTHLQEVELVSHQMLRILEFEKNYVQVGSEELKNVDVERFVTEASLLFSDLKGAELINECSGLIVLADSMLRQLLYNMMDNTLKYGKKTSRIRVHYKEEKNQLKLMYEDDGVGIPDEEKSKLFQEGYGKGTGFGLFLIKRICEAYGWTIQETGEYGKGVQFTMTIPKISKDGTKLYEIS